MADDLGLLLAGVALAFVGGGGGKRGSSSSSGGSSSGGSSSTTPPTGDLASALAAVPMPEAWASFLRVVAQRESGNDPLRAAGIREGAPSYAKMRISLSEATQSGRAYDRNRARFASSGFPRSRYAWGTGGLFGMMPTYALAAFFDTPGQDADPWIVFDPVAAVVCSLAYASRLMGHKSYVARPTFATVRAGWAASSKMSDAAFIAKRKPVWSADATAAGVDPGILDQTPPALPTSGWWTLYGTLGA